MVMFHQSYKTKRPCQSLMTFFKMVDELEAKSPLVPTNFCILPSLDAIVCAWLCFFFFSSSLNVISFNSRLSNFFIFPSTLELVISKWKIYIFKSWFFYFHFHNSFLKLCLSTHFLLLLFRSLLQICPHLSHARQHVFDSQTLITMNA